jgi:hypothetical protein
MGRTPTLIVSRAGTTEAWSYRQIQASGFEDADAGL